MTDIRAMRGSIGFQAARRGRSPRRVAAGMALAALASACTALPEWADPGGWFEDEVEPPARISAAQDPAQAQAGDFPNLASVPDAPREAMAGVERRQVVEGLAADRANAQYSGERLVGDGTGQPAGPGAVPPAPEIARGLGAAPSSAAPTLPRQQAMAPPSPAPAPAPSPVAAPAPSPIPAPAPAQAQQAQAQVAISVPLPASPRRSELAAIVYFAHGSANLNADDRAILRSVAALHRERGGLIRVVGHASARSGTLDLVKHRVANLEMSQKRADSVAAALIRLGVARDAVRSEARADTQPVYHEFMTTGEAGNRRTEIFLEY